MIYLATGTPGAGKTLNTIEIVHKRALKEGRVVYYSNIKDVVFEDWIELENPENWKDELPEGAIYFCDEFYINFPKLSPSKQRPKHYEDLAVHRHQGLDIYFVCQGVLQIDSFIKTLIYEHKHYMKHPFLRASRVYKTMDLMPSPTTKAGRANSEKNFKWFNKKYIGTYKSSVVDTSKAFVPKAYILLLVVLIVLAFLFWNLTRISEDYKKSGIPTSSTQKTNLSSKSNFNSRDDLDEGFDPLVAYVPKVAGLPATAPAYYELQRPVDFPRPTCVMSTTRCQCYTQQATLMVNYPDILCRDHVRHGLFDPTKSRKVATRNKSKRKDKLKK